MRPEVGSLQTYVVPLPRMVRLAEDDSGPDPPAHVPVLL
jgi:hypothetical protein